MSIYMHIETVSGSYEDAYEERFALPKAAGELLQMVPFEIDHRGTLGENSDVLQVVIITKEGYKREVTPNVEDTSNYGGDVPYFQNGDTVGETCLKLREEGYTPVRARIRRFVHSHWEGQPYEFGVKTYHLSLRQVDWSRVVVGNDFPF